MSENKMNSDRIKEIQQTMTAYPNSRSVALALNQVWNECQQQANQQNQELQCQVESLQSSLLDITHKAIELKKVADNKDIRIKELEDKIEGLYEVARRRRYIISKHG